MQQDDRPTDYDRKREREEDVTLDVVIADAKKPIQTGELFDRRVDEYDIFVHSTVIGYDGIRDSIRDIVRLYFPSGTRPRALDLGVGTGNTSLAVLEACPAAEIVGYDVSSNMVKRTAERLRDRNAQFLCGNVLDIDYKGEFDLVVSSIVYHHLSDEEKEQGYGRVFEALKDGGIFVLADVMVTNESNLNKLLQQRWAEHMEQQRGPEFRDEILGLDQEHHRYATLNDNLRYLNRQGFRTEIYWRKANSAVILAFK